MRSEAVTMRQEIVPAQSAPCLPLSYKREGERQGVPLIGVFTTVVWLGCLAAGVAGLKLRYADPKPPPRAIEPVQAQLLDVEVTKAAIVPPETGKPSQPAAAAQVENPPASPAPPEPPAAPALVALAPPSPSIAFAQPMPELAHRTDAPAAAAVPQAQPASTPTAVPAGPRQLTFGEGEGRQPAPAYPREAAIAHQEGTVVVTFTVDPSGRVTQAEASSPSAFPLLNQAALRAVRERWRFQSGPVRTYEVAIQFQLRQK